MLALSAAACHPSKDPAQKYNYVQVLELCVLCMHGHVASSSISHLAIIITILYTCCNINVVFDV